MSLTEQIAYHANQLAILGKLAGYPKITDKTNGVSRSWLENWGMRRLLRLVPEKFGQVWR